MTYFHETCRCPHCLELGRFGFEHGSYECLKCGMRNSASTLQAFLKAFDQGRAYERSQQMAMVAHEVPRKYPSEGPGMVVPDGPAGPYRHVYVPTVLVPGPIPKGVPVVG